MGRASLGLASLFLLACGRAAVFFPTGGASAGTGMGYEEGTPTVTTLAGNGKYGFTDGTGGRHGTAEFDGLKGIAIDADDNVYVSDGVRIRRIDPQGNVLTFTGNGHAGTVDGSGGLHGTGQLAGPVGLAFDDRGTLFVADGSYLRKVDRGGNIQTPRQSSNGGPAALSLAGLAVDVSDTVYATDSVLDTLIEVSAAGHLSLLVGTSGETPHLISPAGLARDAFGNLYVADSGNNRIAKASPGSALTTWAGKANAGHRDGPGATAEFDGPEGVALDAKNRILVADSRNHRIRRIDEDGTVSTLAGTGQAGDLDGTGDEAQFEIPVAVAVSAGGDIYVADQVAVRKISFQ